MHIIVENFFSTEELSSIARVKGFNPWITTWTSLESLHAYQSSIVAEAEKSFDLSTLVGVEEWQHNPAFRRLPGEHYDKDESLWQKEEQLVFPLCSCILYMKVENLVGSNLVLNKEIEITPQSNMLVLLPPGLLHEVTPHESGVRTSINLNLWNYKVR